MELPPQQFDELIKDLVRFLSDFKSLDGVEEAIKNIKSGQLGAALGPLEQISKTSAEETKQEARRLISRLP